MIPRVTAVEVTGPHSLRLTFSDGARKQVNLLALLGGPIFRPLLEPSFFRQVLLDPVAGTVVWPNGADIAPETLYGLPEEAQLAPGIPGRSPKPLRRSASAGQVAEKPKVRRRAVHHDD
jgi:hypothetical protein